MPPFQREHLILPTQAQSLPYTSPISGRSRVIPRPIGNRQNHGESIRDQFLAAIEASVDAPDFEGVYVVFKSPLDFFLDIDKFDKGNFRLASYKSISSVDGDGKVHIYYEATVCLNPRAVTQFLTKIEQYITQNTSNGNPKNLSLIANIDEIRAATLQSFWQEPELKFPALDEMVWWEVWFNRNGSLDNRSPLETLRLRLVEADVQVSAKNLKFPEHLVYLMHCTARQLQNVLYSDKLAELRKPRETADFFTTLEHQEQGEWIADLVGRVDNLSEESNIAICLLDTGVNLAHPLLANLIPVANLDTVNPAWTTADTRTPYGHGTPMAGLALYGDLIEHIGGIARVQIYHHLESIKFINDNAPHDPVLYGAVTQEAIARGELIHPNFKRVICMAVTCADTDHKGRPTSWSAAIDQSLFGSIEEPNDNILVVVSSGNLSWEDRATYPIGNADFSIEDPAQSCNAITVGAYTLKDSLDSAVFPDSEIIAKRGSMSPCNTTSIGWLHEWCKKPDIVMEGGNNAIQYGGVINPESLLLLSTARGGIGRSLITTFSDTSAATALASKFAAELYVAYPDLRPETIRALMVHSAYWTPEMLGRPSINQLTPMEKERLLAHVGFGVPNLAKAMYSLNNSLCMIIERVLTPFRIDESTVKTNEFHLFDLPWPVEALQDLLGTVVRFTITLSYFIEPNPGNKTYELSASYRSHGLRFKMINPNESVEAFQGRVSRVLREEDYTAGGSENWTLGSQLRDKGSLHKDIWEGTAADLATRNKIAVYPVGGWWKTRKRLARYNNAVRYSLIMTIDTPSVDTDIYTPVAIQIPIQI